MRTTIAACVALVFLTLWPVSVEAGYTHYFTWLSQPDPDEIARCVERMSQVVNAAGNLVAGIDGTGEVEILSHELAFNGRVPLDHEPFVFPGQAGFNFCKTAYKPYDAVVTAALIVARDCFPADLLEITSDGPWPAWSDGAELYTQTFGSEPTTSLTEELGDMDYLDGGMSSLLLTGLVFVLVFGFFVFFMRRMNRINAESLQRQREYVARSQEHMNRVEEMLSRLLEAVERDSNSD